MSREKSDLCPYDVETSPFEPSSLTPLPPAPDDALELAFEGPLGVVRRTVAQAALRAGLPPAKVDDTVLAVDEVATNSLRHGGGAGVLRVWTTPGEVVCEVADTGYVSYPFAGRQLPPTDTNSGRGLWLVNHVCDAVEVRSSPAGTVTRLHVRSAHPG